MTHKTCADQLFSGSFAGCAEGLAPCAPAAPRSTRAARKPRRRRRPTKAWSTSHPAASWSGPWDRGFHIFRFKRFPPVFAGFQKFVCGAFESRDARVYRMPGRGKDSLGRPCELLGQEPPTRRGLSVAEPPRSDRPISL